MNSGSRELMVVLMNPSDERYLSFQLIVPYYISGFLSFVLISKTDVLVNKIF